MLDYFEATRGPGREENGSPIATRVSADKAWTTDGSCQVEGVFELLIFAFAFRRRFAVAADIYSDHSDPGLRSTALTTFS